MRNRRFGNKGLRDSDAGGLGQRFSGKNTRSEFEDKTARDHTPGTGYCILGQKVLRRLHGKKNKPPKRQIPLLAAQMSFVHLDHRYSLLSTHIGHNKKYSPSAQLLWFHLKGSGYGTPVPASVLPFTGKQANKRVIDLLRNSGRGCNVQTMMNFWEEMILLCSDSEGIRRRGSASFENLLSVTTSV